MYTPAPFVETRVEAVHALIREYPLAVLVSYGGNDFQATHAPMVLHPEIGARGALRCHVARANPQWQAVGSNPRVLAIFTGPEHYISPSWYPSKRKHGRVVPTWNYIAIHVSGRAALIDGAALLAHLQELTVRQESVFPQPWKIEDAPGEFIASMMKAIVGIEIAIDKIEAKWKAGQNRPLPDRIGAIEGLEAMGSPRSRAMAAEMERFAGKEG
jgi:transcriptional regulator